MRSRQSFLKEAAAVSAAIAAGGTAYASPSTAGDAPSLNAPGYKRIATEEAYSSVGTSHHLSQTCR